MGELDPEVVARAVAWCAEAGRRVGEAEIRSALGPLGRDELLAIRAVLADPPPARPLGPHALVDLARGVAPEVAAERERLGRYRAESQLDRRQEPASRLQGRNRRSARPTSGVVVRRARDRTAAAPAAPARLPALDELCLSEGRATLERLVRRLGPRRTAVLRALAEGWRRPDGTPPDEADLESLLDHHGMARAFERRERAQLLHALRAALGVVARAAASLDLSPEAFQVALRRLGAEREAEAIREDGRREVRRRATLAERARLLTSDQERLGDLGILEEVAADLGSRLPDHLRALRAGRPPSLAAALGRSLSLSRPAVDALAARLGLDLGPAQAPEARAERSRGARGRPGGGPRQARPRGPGRSRKP
ncbi:MAG TPA: hypothetical protein VFR85_12200 [Anaeromyxobacteraceae bacterium]|nr:hypothetical protein [Anaeromyxobacteraceae bacterium]